MGTRGGDKSSGGNHGVTATGIGQGTAITVYGWMASNTTVLYHVVSVCVRKF